MTDTTPFTSLSGKIRLLYNHRSSEHLDNRSITAENIEFKAFIKSFHESEDEKNVDALIQIEANPVKRSNFPSTGWFAFCHMETYFFPHGDSSSEKNYDAKRYQHLFREWNGEIENSIIIKSCILSSDLSNESTGYLVDDVCCINVKIYHTVAFRVVPSVSIRAEPILPRRHAEDFFRLLFHKTSYSDGRIINSGHIIPIHTLLLISRNTVVFGSMFTSPEFVKTRTIDITNCKFSNAAVLSVLRWLYRQELVMTSRLASRVYKVAHRWQIVPVLHACRCFIDQENIWSFLNLAKCYGDDEMIACCLDAFDRLKSQPFNTLGFSRANIDDIAKVVEMKSKLLDKSLIISALVGWARARSGNSETFTDEIVDLLKPVFALLEFDKLTAVERTTLIEEKNLSHQLLDQLSTVIPQAN